ncbi:protein PIF-like [Mya arenaria]|uniref:protein PIF-like n=1 Tax=Mya arenaria TaxID=6604 RepID=UPI0022E808F1|nr:protein PIF-like [Mya arenaria]
MMHQGLAIAVLLFGIVYRTQTAPTFSGLCDGCPLKNGVGLTGFLNDCTKYVHCAEDAQGVVHGTVQPCAFGTEWNQNLLTCVPPSNSTCGATQDICYGQPNYIRRLGVGNCRGYWECKNGDSVPLCCPIGYYFNIITGNCDSTDSDHECYDKCFNEYYEDTMKMTTTPSPCYNKRPVAAELDVYEEWIEGWGWIQRGCPIGLQYVQRDCDCTRRVVVQQKCEPDLFLTFESGIKDQSNLANYILSENVEVMDGKAFFKADQGSQLIIPRYTNVGMASLTIHVKYYSDHESLTHTQAIVSNSDCGITPSILLTEDSRYVYFTVRTDLGESTLAVHQPALTNEKDVVLTYHNGNLSGQVNGIKNTMIINGSGISRVHCALHVGSADANRGLNFTGVIDELSLSMCV